MKKSPVLAAVLAAGMALGCGTMQEDVSLHTETFEVYVFEDYSMRGEPVDAEGNRIAGEGVAIDNEQAREFIEETGVRTGDIVDVSWTHNQARFEDWETPAKIELKEDKTP